MRITVYYQEQSIDFYDKVQDNKISFFNNSYPGTVYLNEEELDDFIQRLTELKKLFKNA